MGFRAAACSSRWFFALRRIPNIIPRRIAATAIPTTKKTPTTAPVLLKKRSELVRASFEPRVGFSTTSVTVDAEPSWRVVTVTIVMIDGVVTTVWPWLSVTVWTTWLVNVGACWSGSGSPGSVTVAVGSVEGSDVVGGGGGSSDVVGGGGSSDVVGGGGGSSDVVGGGGGSSEVIGGGGGGSDVVGGGGGGSDVVGGGGGSEVVEDSEVVVSGSVVVLLLDDSSGGGVVTGSVGIGVVVESLMVVGSSVEGSGGAEVGSVEGSGSEVRVAVGSGTDEEVVTKELVDVSVSEED